MSKKRNLPASNCNMRSSRQNKLHKNCWPASRKKAEQNLVWRHRAEAILSEAPIAVALPAKRQGKLRTSVFSGIAVAAGVAGVVGWSTLDLSHAAGLVAYKAAPAVSAAAAGSIVPAVASSKLRMSYQLAAAPAAEGDVKSGVE